MATNFANFFGKNVTDKVSNQKTYYYATSNNLCFCITWQNGEMRKSHFTQMLYQCIAWIQPAVWFLQSFWLTTHTHDAVWLPKSCNQCVQPAGLLAAWFTRKEVESTAGVGLCCTCSAPVRCLLGFLFCKIM